MRQRNSDDPGAQDAVWKVALKILRYLAENPNAADTAEGILEWWLFKQFILEEEQLVEQALERLVEQNLLLTAQAGDARKHYQLNRERIEESRNLIHKADTDRFA